MVMLVQDVSSCSWADYIQVVANMLEIAVDRLLTIDLHAAQIPRKGSLMMDHLMGARDCRPTLNVVAWLKEFWLCVSPDHGGVTRARKLAEFWKHRSPSLINVGVLIKWTPAKSWTSCAERSVEGKLVSIWLCEQFATLRCTLLKQEL